MKALHAALFVALAALLGCTAESSSALPPTSPSPASPPPSNATDPSSALPPPGPPGSFHGSLSPYLNIVEVRTSTSFAHDHGDITEIEAIRVGGKPCERGDLVAAIVAHWKGWSAKGGRADADVLRTMQELVIALDRLLEVDRVTDETIPDDLTSTIGRVPGLSYHPPRYVIEDVKGTRVVIASGFVRGHISQRGRHWRYAVEAYRVDDGRMFDVTKHPSLPQPQSFSEGG